MKKTYLLIVTMILGCACPMMAQYDNEDETEITVTDAEGNEEVIDLPEGMTYELDSLLSLYNNQTYLKPDGDCNLPDVNPTYDKEDYKRRLSQLPTIMEMPYNDVVQQFIDRYSGRLRHTVALMLGAQNFYMPIFEEALEAYGMPLELKYLPVIESSLNPNAVSRVGATGLWQFMLTTGKQYGLEVNSLVDERRDPIKASYAAAHYLSDLYRIFGDWSLVIAAYNCGPENINKAIHRAKGETDYWKIYPYLPRETRGYVPAFIAANYIMNYYCEHNICPMTTDLPAKSDTIVVNRDVHFEQISHTLNIPVSQLKELNPQYRHNIVNGSSKLSAIRLPELLVNAFIDHEDSIYAYRAEELLSKRTEVEVSEESPAVQPRKTYTPTHNSKAVSRKSKSARKEKTAGRHSKSKRKGSSANRSNKSSRSNKNVRKGSTSSKKSKSSRKKGRRR